MGRAREAKAGWRGRIALLLGSTALLLGGLEGAVRVVRRSVTSPTTHPDLVQHHPERGWSYRPGARIRHRSDEFDVEVWIDEDGFRRPTEGEPGRAGDLLCLGDSFTFGWGVEARESYPRQLAAALGREVHGGGVSGYGTDQELLLFRSLPADYRLVVLQFCGNDLEEVRHHRRYGAGKPRFVRDEAASGGYVLTGVPVPDPWLHRNSALWRLVRRRWERMGLRAPTTDEVQEGRETVQGLMRMLDAEVAERGGRLLVVHEGEEWLREGLATAGIPSLDLGPGLEDARDAGRNVAFPEDGHWTAAGHAVVAELLADWIRRRGL